MAEARFHQLQVTPVASQALLVAAYCIRKALSAEAPDPGPDSGIVEVLVEGDHQDFVEQSQPLELASTKAASRSATTCRARLSVVVRA